MYGLKTPTYRGTNLKSLHDKPMMRTSDFKITKSNAKLYIAKSISDDVTHGMNTLMNDMVKDIMRNGSY